MSVVLMSAALGAPEDTPWQSCHTAAALQKGKPRCLKCYIFAPALNCICMHGFLYIQSSRQDEQA